jgi:hypothetical protein
MDELCKGVLCKAEELLARVGGVGFVGPDEVFVVFL